MDFDRYPFLSPKRQRAADPEAVLALVRATWPGAFQQGSTGYERSWIAETPQGRRLVAHSWSPKKTMDFFWVRVAATLDDSMDDGNMALDPRLARCRRGR